MAIKGLDVFGAWFAGHRDKYVLIGGAAAQSIMAADGLEFRATKDLDVVLVVEALTPEFGELFWEFVRAGGYVVRETGDTGRPTFYRFTRPADDTFPVMVELFAREPDLLKPIQDGHLTPIPFDEAVSSLSAILLDGAYYDFIIEGRREVAGVPMIAEDRLIPLKALAWLELSSRREAGEEIDSRNVRKHLNDVLRLSGLLTEDSVIHVSGKIAEDMRRFLVVAVDTDVDLKALGFNRASLPELLRRIATAFGLEPKTTDEDHGGADSTPQAA
ncbi:hypothetical protein ABFU27_15685 [Xanthomonas campestris pv. raphani]|uniref:hypothetical protein n=1 Tax=Xanthomonas campestris TaxID=339 RepID=UPI001E2A320C|nr:hypothetical protein [Xanthomonas campestris]MCC8685655.1 hypothetical protein [Xanthomonas campestris]MCC8689702.1 hypothetical protein [Xanthomonas campestris]MEA9678168.1 hypothetical protein [Xanthomonas campestris pv. raphani]MEA9698535.1 hypothetical protein [Xanthomonas campestris pv. raphani]MEA9770235.1 hypothetical protein [Xanthomonas campestris pv. raphani]